jgi:hypothetical protein
VIAIELNNDSTVGELRELLGKVRNPQGMLRTVATRAEDMLKAHFRSRDANSPNKLGGRRKHFWKAVEESVWVEVSDTEGAVILTVSHPHFAQKVFGGVIRVKQAKHLTIPVTAEAYGKTTAEFEAETGLNLFQLPTRKGGSLAARVKGAKDVKVHYVLRSSVYQEKDEAALPDRESMSAMIAETVKEELGRG